MLDLLPKGDFTLDAPDIIASRERKARRPLSHLNTNAIEAYCDAASTTPDSDTYDVHISRLGERLLCLLKECDFAGFLESIAASRIRKAILRYQIIRTTHQRKHVEWNSVPILIIKHFFGSIITAPIAICSDVLGIFRLFTLLIVGNVGEIAQQASYLKDSRYLRLISRYIYSIYYDIKSKSPLDYCTMGTRWLRYAQQWKRWKYQDHSF